MDHPCYKCGQSVEDGVPFCSHCGAPQIRVAVVEAAPALGVSSDEPAHAVALQSERVPTVLVPVGWPQALRPCLFAALIGVLGVTMGLYPVAAMFGAGVLAVVFHRQRAPGTEVSAGLGARLGVLSGLLFFGMAAAVGAMAVAAFHKGPEIRSLMLETIRQAASQTADQQAQAMFSYFRSAEGFPVFLLLSVLGGFLGAILLGTLGGALAGAFLGRRARS
jgi:hypothetical protein